MKSTEAQMGLWELEFLKCQTKRSLRKYIEKYESIPENIYRQRAIEKLKELSVAKKSKMTVKTVKSSLKVNEVLPFLGYFAGIAIIIIIISIGKDWIKDYTKQEYKPYIPVINPVKPINPDPVEPVPNPRPVPNPSPIPVPTPYPYPEPTPTPTPIPEPDNSHWIQYYTNQYSEMERQAEREYNSLTNLGSRYMDNGQLAGATGRNDSYIASQISSFKQLQHRMRDLRFEASKQGVNISQSYWETVDVH